MRSLKEINKEIHSEINMSVSRPKQLMDQDAFNSHMLKCMNTFALQYSKGKRSLQITSENEWLLKVVFAYLNRNADDKELTYSVSVKDDTVTKTLDLDKGLLILGNFGIGKTLLIRLIHSQMQFLQLTGRFVTSRQMYDCKPQDYINVIGGDKYGLFIDDLGDEPLKAVEYGNEDTPVATVLKNRMDNWERLPESPKLFVTSNCSPDVLKQRYGGRILSRMYASMNVIITNQKTDYRKL